MLFYATLFRKECVMIPKIFVILVMLVILICLGSGLVFLVRDVGATRRTVKSLTWRIGLSFALFLLLLLGFSLGLINPHGL